MKYGVHRIPGWVKWIQPAYMMYAMYFIIILVINLFLGEVQQDYNLVLTNITNRNIINLKKKM